MIRETFGNNVHIDWLFDPAIGTGMNLRMMSTEVQSEQSFKIADAAAERGDDKIADTYWQMGAMTEQIN